MKADDPCVLVYDNKFEVALKRLRKKINHSRVFVTLKRRNLNPSPGARRRAKVARAAQRRFDKKGKANA